MAQSYHETERFTKLYEGKPNEFVRGGPFYRGRGLLHVTHKDIYEEFYKEVYAKEPAVGELESFVPTLATSLGRACEGAAWYWKSRKANQYATADEVDNVSASINRPVAVNGDEDELNRINGRDFRKLYYNLLKVIFDYDECKNK